MASSSVSATAPTGYPIAQGRPAQNCLVQTPTSPLTRNKQVVERIWDELVNGGRVEALDELVSADFVDHAPLPGLPNDLGGLRERLLMLHRAFPDFHSTIVELVAEGDKVMARVESTGTHQAAFMGLPATGRRFKIEEIQILKIRDGKMTEHWQVADLHGMLVQLGFAN